MARGGNSNTHKSLLLISLMILMTQVGYLDNLNPWTTGEETLDETDDVMETGGSGSTAKTLSSSAEGANLIVGIPMTDITFGTTTASSSSLALGYNHACGILDNGSVKCWGADSAGRLGQGTATQVIGDAPSEMGDALAVTNLGTGRTATSISAGLPTSSAHTCAVLDDGSVKCWGWNDNGQLGIGNTTTMGDAADRIGDNLAAVDLGTGRTATDVSVGDRFSCALLDNGDVKCWGRNQFGQLGIGNTTTMGDAPGEMGDNLSAVDLGTGRTAVAIATGYDHVCAILDNGQVKCWGTNVHGRLGIENTTAMGSAAGEMGDNLSYTSLGTGLTPVHIDAGNGHTCALFDNGSVKCWGFNQYGNLGLGNNSHQGDASNEMGDDLSFVDLGTGRTAVDLTAMTQSVCVVLDNGDVKCWGRNQHGQLGIGSTMTIGDGSNEMGDNLATTDLGTGVKALAVGGGFSHACAIIENGSLKCWGSNGFGMLGIGSVEQIVGDNGNEMGDNLPFVNLGTGASMLISQFTSCTSSPNLPPGLSMNNCIISGTPSSPFTNQTYNISAVRDGVTYQASIYLSASYLELTPSAEGVDLSVGVPMDDITFEYTGPTTYGNYSTWQATNINSPSMSMPGAGMQILVGDTFYFDASDQNTGTELWAYDTSNHSEWRVDDIRSGSQSSQPGTSMSILVGDTIYFSAEDGSTGIELWAHDTSNHSAWRVDDINSGPGDSYPGNLMELLVGDTLYFSADDGSTGRELWAHNTSNSSVPWQVADINSGGGHSDPGKHLSMVIDDVLYFSADDGSTGGELYAYNTSNGSDPWLVADLFSGGTGSSPGTFMQVLVDDTIYFDARGGNPYGIELWAYDTSDHSTQRVTDINSGTGHSRPGAFFSTLVDDTIYFSATDGTTGVELWAYDTSNHSTWRVADINSGSQDSKPGEHLNLLVGDTIYFSADDGSTDVELWAHDTSNHSTWRVDDICSVGSCNLGPAYGRPDGSAPGYNMQVLVGDTFYFDAFTSSTGVELWAHDTSNDSTWNVAEMTSGTGSGISAISFSMLQIAVGDTLYFSAQDGSNSMELWAHRGAEFTPPPANVNGASSCSSSPSLPLGLSIDSSTCTISGTPMVETINRTYNVTAVISGVTYQTSVWLSSSYLELTPSVEGADLYLDVPMTNITFEFNDSSMFTLTNPTWTPSAISTSANGPMGVYAADVDGDGDLDIVTASKTDSSSNGKVTWWENGGSGTWTANDIATAVDARSVYVEDIDGDGDLDVVAALFAQDTIKLYLNSGASNPTWTASNIDTNANGATDVHVADMDGDGDLDVVSSSLDDDTIAWYKNDGQASPGWTSTNIDTNRQSARAVDVADMDGDGDLDIVTASSGDDTIAWYANGGQSTPSFTKTDISSTADAARDVRVADMDGDGDLDIVSASYGDDTIAWYENNGQAASWSSGVDIVTNASGAESVFVADLDNDGDLDIVSGSADDDTVAWYENDGQTDPSWDAYDISTSYDARGIHIADVDGDGDLDVLSVSHNDNTVALFEQTGTRTWSNSMVNVTGASSCTASPTLSTGLLIDSSTCTISGTPTVETINRTYTVTAVISGVTYQGSVWLSASYLELTPSVEGADLYLDEAMTNITFQYNASAASGSGSGSGSGSNSGTYNGNGTAWMVENIASINTVSSFPEKLTAVGNTLFFKANNGQDGFELWKSNGTSSGTVMVKNINSGSGSQASSNPNYLTEMGNTLYFSAMDTTNNGHQLWKSDGTASGTVMVTAINSGGTANPGIHTDGLVVMNNNLYFSAEDGTNGVELWKSDGTASGTVMVKDINPGSGESFSYTPAVKPVVMNNELYFQAKDGTSGLELWKSDGTASGTVMVKDIYSGSSDSYPSHLTVVGNTLYFTANDGTNGYELWKSDGTASGTVMVKDIKSGSGQAYVDYLTAVGNTLYLQANDGTNGAELWKSDGTASGTVMVKDISTSASSSCTGNAEPTDLTAVGNTLYFSACSDTWGRELWKSDGTSSGTLMVKNIRGGAGSALTSYADPVAVGNTLYFPANDGTSGVELWKSDGTTSGTVMVQDITGGISGSSSSPENFAVVGNTLFFRANDGTNGAELWALDPANITGLSSGSGSGSSGGMTNVTGATSCTASPNLPTGLNIDSSTCTISGTPTVEAVNATYEINATIGGVTYIGSVWLSAAPFGTITSAVEGAALNLGEAMTPIALNYTSQAPPGSSGNGTTWIPTPPAGIDTYAPRMADYFMLEHDDVIYFDAMMSNGKKAVYAFSTVNGTMWNTYDINSINSATNSQPYTGEYLAKFVGDDLFFTIKNGSGISVYELWVYSTSNGTTWRAMQQTASTYGFAMEFVIGNRLYFDESHFGSQMFKFGVYDTSNHTYWNHSTTILSPTVGSCDVPGANFHTTVGDTIYFDACDASQSYGNEMYAFNTINGSYWRTTDLDNGANDSNPGERMHIVIDDVIYFDAQVGTGAINHHALYAYNTSNGTSWLAADLRKPGYDMTPHSMDTAMPRREPVVIGDTLYFDAAASLYTARTSIGYTCSNHQEIYAYNIGNQTAWCVADAGGGGWSGSGHNSGAAHNMLHLIGDVLLFDAETGSTQGGTQTRTNSLWAHNLSNGSTWEITTKTTSSDIISEVGTGFAVFSIDNTLYFPAKNATVGLEVWGYDIVNQTYWLANDTCPGVFNGISGGSFHTLVHQGVFYSSVRISQNGLGEQHILGVFNPVPSSSTSSGGSGGGSSGGSSGVTWSTHPALPAGMSISAGVISGTPTVYALNQTYTIYANQSGYSTTHELYFSVDTDNAHTVVENQTIDPIGFHPPFSGGTTTWTVSPNLPSSLTNSSTTGEITGTVTSTTTNATYTVTATHSDGSVETFTFSLRSLADYDGDGLPNDLPSDYDAAEGPTPGLVADTDDDADGLLDTVETNTGTYVDSSNTGTDPLNPDTDGDGICDGPNAVASVCIAGPDTNSGATVITTPVVLVNNSEVSEISPFVTYIFATYGLSPDLPTSMHFDSSNGSIWGTPDMLMTNTTYTMWANLSDGTTTSWTFFLEVLEDLDGDGMPDVLPGDYDAVNDPIRTPGLEEDLDDDGDGYNDTAETDTGLYLDGNNTGTDPRDPDTDDDGICDGPGTVAGVCTAGPDLTPFGPPATVVAVNNTMIPSVPPYYAGSGLTYEASPDLPNGLTIDPNNGYLMGIPTVTTGNITYTVYANDTNGNTYSWDFTIEVLEDSDGDGLPDTLPSDYDGDDDSIRPPPGLTEDLDDDNDGMSDEDEITNGTEPLNPDTDGDGFCDGINAVAGVCFAGPDPYPNDANLPLDTDGDGLPDDDSDWTGPPYADDDDDNDGFPDASEEACGSDSLDANSIPADMDGDTICDGDDLDMDGDGIDNVNETGETGVPPGTSPTNPDTDGDGICDGPTSPVTSNCTAGPDAFPLDPAAWEDTDGDGYPNDLYPPSTSVPPLEEDTDDDNDGWSDIEEVNCGSDPLNATDMPVDENGDGICDVLDLDWDDDGIPNANETDTGIYNDPSDTGTDPWNPDTDGDGFCDGPLAVSNGTVMICTAGPDPFPHDPTMPLDTDGDGDPDSLPVDYIGNLIEDLDDDNDGHSDAEEDLCGSDSLDNMSMPTDLDGDTICDGQDPDVDGDGLSNEVESATDSLTNSSNADSDGDGICDGPSAPALPAGICAAGPDAFPDDPAAWLDTDGDGDPDDIVDGVTTDLVLDTDDDNDQWSDEDEADCGTDSKDDMSTPFDGDDDGICDVLDTQTLHYTIYNGTDWIETNVFETYVNQSDFMLKPNLTGMEQGTWSISPALPAGLEFSGTQIARSGETGYITGVPTESSPMTNYTVTADNGRVSKSFTFQLAVLNDTDGDSLPDEPSVTGLETDLDDDNDGHLDAIELKCGSDPTNQTSVPDVDMDGNCIEGKYSDEADDDSSGVFLWCLPLIILLLVLLFLIPLLIRDRAVLLGPEPENTTSEPDFLSGAGTKDDPFVLKPIKALKAGTMAEAKETISIINMSPEIRVNLLDLAEATNEKRFRMYEVDGSTEEPGFNLDADEEGRLRLRFVFDDSDVPTYPGGTYEGLLKLGKASVYLSWTVEVKEDKRKMNKIRKEREAAEKAEKEAKEAEEKAKAEAEAKEAEEKAKAEAEAKAAEEKAAKEAEKKAKAEEKAAKKPATTKEAKKEEELQRVKERAKTIDFNVIGEATSTKLKGKVKKGADSIKLADASAFAESGSAEVTDADGSTIIAWTGKDGNVLTGVTGISRAFAASSIVLVKDDLQAIKGVGPFLEEKLNALGITTYQQVANMNDKLEEQVNEAIEFFPGRVKRDQWVAQAKVLLGMEAELNKKALKEAEEQAKAEAEAKAAEEKAAKEAEEKAKAEAEAKAAKEAEEKAAAAAAAKKAKEEQEAKKKAEAEAKAAEEKAAKEAEEKAAAAAAAKKAKEEEEAKKKAEAEAKAAEEKAAKEAEEKAKAEAEAKAAKEAEEKAAAAAAAKKAKEEEEAKKKAEAEAKAAEEKAAKEAEEKAKAEAAAKKKAEKKPAATKEAKKQEELQRVKQRAKTIDFKVIGEASSSELKSEVKKGATTLEVANAKDFAESGSAEINDAKGTNVIAWTGKDGNTLTGVSGVTRVFAAKAVLMVKDDLQVIKGIGPFIEEKLNALGITTYRQLANMTAKLETQVNEAIEFFPGRVKRDQWVAQAKILLGMDAKLDEKALKQAEELERVAQKAEGIDFDVLGVASASEADDLQKIKGIGPFIAEKLNALGIFKFSQLANMTSEIEEEVNVAIEFFPGRVKRDEWAKQAKEFAKD